jgi:NAD+ diphosphatase
MLVVDGEKDIVLLGHAPRFDEKMYSALAGFIEPGEGIDDAVRRETMEEAGIEVGDVHFHMAQPWPFPHSLMLGCFAQARTTAIKIDAEELTDARWFTRTELTQMLAGKHPDGYWVPGKQAIARTLMEAWAAGLPSI